MHNSLDLDGHVRHFAGWNTSGAGRGESARIPDHVPSSVSSCTHPVDNHVSPVTLRCSSWSREESSSRQVSVHRSWNRKDRIYGSQSKQSAPHPTQQEQPCKSEPEKLFPSALLFCTNALWIFSWHTLFSPCGGL
jgi:hypothetical protein